MPKRKLVKSWDKRPKQAAYMTVGLCGDRRAPKISFDMNALDGSAFAHAHTDPERAEEFVASIIRAIAEAKKVQAAEADARRQESLESDAKVEAKPNG